MSGLRGFGTLSYAQIKISIFSDERREPAASASYHSEENLRSREDFSTIASAERGKEEALNFIQRPPQPPIASTSFPPVNEATTREVSEDVLPAASSRKESKVIVAEKKPSAGAAAKKLPPRKGPLNDFEKYIKLRKRIELSHKNLFPVTPKAPEGFEDWIMNKKDYLLRENAHERLKTVPVAQTPSSLKGPFKDLFEEQEKERFKLRTKHVVEKEKLVLSVEQVSLDTAGKGYSDSRIVSC